jgi:hypothetical protein
LIFDEENDKDEREKAEAKALEADEGALSLTPGAPDEPRRVGCRLD